jgi:hypothetical protein
MQKPNFDISLALNILKTLLKHLNELRSEESFEKMIIDSTALATAMGVESVFENSRGRIKPRHIRKHFDYEHNNESVIDPKQQFKINSLNYFTLNVAINSVNDSFEQIKEHNNNLSFFYNLKKLKNLTHENTLKHYKDLQILLTDGDSTDINGIEMAFELKSVSAMVDDNLTPYKLLRFEINADDFAPNLSIALRILLTLPVSVANGERSFSKLKLIKTYLRSTMKNERLCDLAMISIEHEVSQGISRRF